MELELGRGESAFQVWPVELQPRVLRTLHAVLERGFRDEEVHDEVSIPSPIQNARWVANQKRMKVEKDPLLYPAHASATG